MTDGLGGVEQTDRSMPTLKRGFPMDYQSIFAEAIAALHAERRYRVFADLERIAGRYPYALWRNGEEAARDRRLVLQRLSRHGPERDGARRHDRSRPADGRRRRRHPQHLRHESPAGRARGRARRPPRQGSGAGLHLGLRLQRGGDLDHRQDAARLRDPLRRAEPRLDDRGRAALGRAEADLPPQRPRSSRGPPEAAEPSSGRS